MAVFKLMLLYVHLYKVADLRRYTYSFWELECSLCCVVCDIMVFSELSPQSIKAGCVDVGTSGYCKLGMNAVLCW